MQIEKVKCDGKPTNLLVKIECGNSQKIRLMAYNPKKPNTFYTNRVKTVNGNCQFEIRMPQNCETVFVRCVKDGTNEDVKISSCEKTKLNQFIRCVDPRVSSFVKFAQEFSEQLPLLHEGTYYSDNRKYRIDLHNSIKHEGKVIATPARISNVDGRMEVSKSHFMKYTIPMRMAILLHEFSHFNLNVIQKDEVEADLNALRIYLGLGYPTIEAHMSFLNVFKGTPSEQNKERYEYIKSFINNFDEMKYSVCI
jgi:hypothetical protein